MARTLVRGRVDTAGSALRLWRWEVVLRLVAVALVCLIEAIAWWAGARTWGDLSLLAMILFMPGLRPGGYAARLVLEEAPQLIEFVRTTIEAPPSGPVP